MSLLVVARVFCGMALQGRRLEGRPARVRAHARDCASQRAASFAWYVMIMSAPARLMLVSSSSTTRFSSIQPFCAAALTIEYSPDTL